MIPENKKLILIVNGKPRAGKDTFAELLNEFIPVYKYSSIDKVKTIAMDCGWKGAKEEKDRKFLSELKRITTEYNDMAYNDILEKVEMFDNGDIAEEIMIIDVREPEEIERLTNELGALTVFIKNDNVPEVTSNYADANVENFDYDIIVDNSGTLEDFEEAVEEFVYVISILTMKDDKEEE